MRYGICVVVKEGDTPEDQYWNRVRLQSGLLPDRDRKEWLNEWTAFLLFKGVSVWRAAVPKWVFRSFDESFKPSQGYCLLDIATTTYIHSSAFFITHSHPATEMTKCYWIKQRTSPNLEMLLPVQIFLSVSTWQSLADYLGCEVDIGSLTLVNKQFPANGITWTLIYPRLEVLEEVRHFPVHCVRRSVGGGGRSWCLQISFCYPWFQKSGLLFNI